MQKLLTFLVLNVSIFCLMFGMERAAVEGGAFEQDASEPRKSYFEDSEDLDGFEDLDEGDEGIAGWGQSNIYQPYGQQYGQVDEGDEGDSSDGSRDNSYLDSRQNSQSDSDGEPAIAIESEAIIHKPRHSRFKKWQLQENRIKLNEDAQEYIRDVRRSIAKIDEYISIARLEGEDEEKWQKSKASWLAEEQGFEEWANELTDDQLNTHLENNHVIVQDELRRINRAVKLMKKHPVLL